MWEDLQEEVIAASGSQEMPAIILPSYFPFAKTLFFVLLRKVTGPIKISRWKQIIHLTTVARKIKWNILHNEKINTIYLADI